LSFLQTRGQTLRSIIPSPKKTSPIMEKLKAKYKLSSYMGYTPPVNPCPCKDADINWCTYVLENKRLFYHCGFLSWYSNIRVHIQSKFWFSRIIDCLLFISWIELILWQLITIDEQPHINRGCYFPHPDNVSVDLLFFLD